MNSKDLQPLKSTTTLSIILMILTIAAWFLQDFQFSDDSQPTTSSFFVVVKHFGRDARDMETTITIPLENQLRSVRGLERIWSRSELGSSRIELKMSRDFNYPSAFLDIRDAVYQVYAQLPPTVQKPEIYSGSNSSIPAFIVSISSGQKNRSDLETFAHDILKPSLEKIQEAGEVQLGGATSRELIFRLDSDLAGRYGLTSQAFSSNLSSQYVHGSMGTLINGQRLTPVIFQSRFSTIDEVSNFRIRSPNGTFIPFSSIVKIEEAPKDSESISRINGSNALVFYIKQSGQGSSIGLSEKVQAVLHDLSNQGIEYEVLFDKGGELLEAIQAFLLNILTCMIVVGLFTILGLKNWQSSSIVTLSIPFYALLSLTLLHGAGQPIGLSTLMGIGLAVGTVADSGIIIADYMNKSINKNKGVSSNLVASLIFSGLTTIIVTFPLLISYQISLEVQKIALSFFLFISISTILNIVFLPSFLQSIRTKPRSGKSNVIILFNTLIQRTLQVPAWIITTISFFLGITTIIGILFLPKSVSREMTDSLISAHVELPSGSNIAAVDNTLQLLGRNLREIPGITSIESHARRENGTLTIQYEPSVINKEQVTFFVEQQGDFIQNASIFVQSGYDNLLSIPISIQGPDINVILESIRMLGERFGSEQWVKSIVYHFKEGGPVWTFTPRSDRLSSLGVSPASINETLHWALHGPVTLKWINSNSEQDIRVFGSQELSHSIDSFKILPIQTQSSSVVPLGELGNFELSDNNSPIFRQNLQRSMDFSIQTEERNLATLFTNIERVLAVQSLPVGYRFNISSKLLEEEKELQTLLVMVLVSILLIYMILAVEFESFILPFILLTSIPIALFLPLIMIILVEIPFTTHVFVGFIIVVGIVINNSIIITERTLSLESNKTNNNSSISSVILESVMSRLNGIMMTTGSTCVGFLPMILGLGLIHEQIQHLAIVIFLGVAGSFFCGIFLFPPVLQIFLKKKYKSSI